MADGTLEALADEIEGGNPLLARVLREIGKATAQAAQQ